MVLSGGFQFSATFKPVAEAVSKAYGVHGYLMDSYAMKAATQIALGDNFGYVGYVFVLAFFDQPVTGTVRSAIPVPKGYS